MMQDVRAVATVTTTDIDRAKAFYADTLGLTDLHVPSDEAAFFEAGGGTQVMVYWRPQPPSATNTAITLFCDDGFFERVEKLRAAGVELEEYDSAELKTVGGVAEEGRFRACWFKDPDGNLLSLTQVLSPEGH